VLLHEPVPDSEASDNAASLQPVAPDWFKNEKNWKGDPIYRMREYIDALRNETVEKAQLYLFDWSIREACNDLLRDFTVPKYVVNDLLNVHTLNTQWPSLILGPKGARSGVHVDDYGTHFWMIMLEGKKRWKIYPKEDISKLGGLVNYAQMMFLHSGHNKSADHPLLAYTSPYEFDLEAGDMVIVPSNMPHQVENLEPSLAIAGNFLDELNWEVFKANITHHALVAKNNEIPKTIAMRMAERSPVPMDTFKRDMQWTTLPWGHTGGNAKAGKKKGKAMDRILAMETEDTSSE